MSPTLLPADTRPACEPAAPPADTAAALRQAYADARRAGGTRHRDIAQQLGVTEGMLIAAHLGQPPAVASGGLQARRLRPDWPRAVALLATVGEVMALTRNHACVIEKIGHYQAPSTSGPGGAQVGLVLGPQIDLRLFYRHWAHGFAVDELTPRGLQRSLQFFDAQGMALHKVFTRAGTDLDAWAAAVQALLDTDQQPGGAAPPPAAAPEPERPDGEVDLAAFHQAWASLRDTHDFFGLLRQHRLSRTQALRLAEPRFAQPVDTTSAQQLLSAAAANGTPVMVFVGNAGVIQIHTGPVHRVAVAGPWLNVLDSDFNLHLREDLLASAWVVRKPTVDGLVTALELFDAQGETVAMLFGARKPGQAELCGWRALIDDLLGEPRPTQEAACAR